MPRKQRHTPEQVIGKLREAEVKLAMLARQGSCRSARTSRSPRTPITAKRREYGGVRVDQAKRLKELEKENGRLKRLLADAELDKAILREAATENIEPGEEARGGRAAS